MNLLTNSPMVIKHNSVTGVKLSGGQKQRVALARALLSDADLLTLDDATSDLDTYLEQQAQDLIKQMDRDYAMITIAHRLSIVVNADRIYAMDSGKIIQQVKQEDLIDRGGEYADLYAVQS